MSINSLTFLVFVAGALAVYFCMPAKWRWCALLVINAVFYTLSSFPALFYLLLTIAFTYGAARLLEHVAGRQKAQLSALPKEERPVLRKKLTRQKKRLLAAILVLHFATLALFKYLNSWLGTANSLLSLLHVAFRFRPLELLMPLGISFYIFQTAGYLIDVYRGKVAAERNLLKYALFVSYFPQMIQGPINRFKQLQPQLLAENKFSAENLRDGILRILWGTLKKVFIADILAAGVTEIYTNYLSYSGAIVFFGAALYCIQLYADFSGGTDIVLGVSQLFGIHLMENFKRPYFANSLDEFWRRWHISLGEWMKDYVFYPLALSGGMAKLTKKLKSRISPSSLKLISPCISTTVVFLLVGIWQGPGFSNIAYGLYNGLLMSAALACSGLFVRVNQALHIRKESKTAHVLRIVRTNLIIVFGRYFSRAVSFRAAVVMLRQTVTRFTWNLSLPALFSFGLDKWDYLIVLLACLVLLFVSLLQERGVSVRQAFYRKPAAFQFFVLFAAVLLLVAFVYMNDSYTAIAYVYESV